MKTVIFTLLATTLFGLLFQSNEVLAAGNCKPIYGGGENCLAQNNIVVDKKVQSPKSLNFVDNLNENDPKYRAGETINFQLSITNKSGKTLSGIEVSDNLPRLLTYTSGPGSFDTKTRTLTFKFDGLKNNETRRFTLVGKITNTINLNTCVVNHVRVKAGSVTADDNSNFCLEKSVCDDDSLVGRTKGGFPVKPAPKNLSQTPATGSELLPLLSLIPLATAGLYLRKRTGK